MTEQLRIIDQLLGNLHEDEQIVISIDRSAGPIVLKIQRYKLKPEGDTPYDLFDWQSERMISQTQLMYGPRTAEHVIANALLETAVEVRTAKEEAEMKAVKK